MSGAVALLDQLRAALELVRRNWRKIPRPWIDGALTFTEWDTACEAMESALASAVCTCRHDSGASSACVIHDQLRTERPPPQEHHMEEDVIEIDEDGEVTAKGRYALEDDVATLRQQLAQAQQELESVHGAWQAEIEANRAVLAQLAQAQQERDALAEGKGLQPLLQQRHEAVLRMQDAETRAEAAEAQLADLQKRK
jgi:isoleucyl-tRNA synthetase